MSWLAHASVMAGVHTQEMTPIDVPIDVDGQIVTTWSIQPGFMADSLADFIPNAVLTVLWFCYDIVMSVVSWMVDATFQLGLIDGGIGAPMREMMENIRSYLDSIGVVPSILVVSAFVCIIWVVKGQWAKGFIQLLISLVVANYAVASLGSSGAVAEWNPANVVMGHQVEGSLLSEGGILRRTRDFADEIGHRIVDEEAGQDETAPTLGPTLAEALVLNMAMMINFGELLTGDCRKAYAIVQDAAQHGGTVGETRERLEGIVGPGGGKATDGLERIDIGDLADSLGDRLNDFLPFLGGDDGPSNQVDRFLNNSDGDGITRAFHLSSVAGACQHGDFSYYWHGSGSASPANGLLTLGLAGLTVLPLLFFISLGVILVSFATLSAIFQALKSYLALLAACVPGGGRDSLWKSVAALIAALSILFVTSVTVRIVISIMTSYWYTPASGEDTSDDLAGIMQRMAFAGISLVAFTVILWRSRGSIEASRERMANFLSRATGGRENILGDTRPNNFSTWYNTVRDTTGPVLGFRALRREQRAERLTRAATTGGKLKNFASGTVRFARRAALTGGASVVPDAGMGALRGLGKGAAALVRKRK